MGSMQCEDFAEAPVVELGFHFDTLHQAEQLQPHRKVQCIHLVLQYAAVLHRAARPSQSLSSSLTQHTHAH